MFTFRRTELLENADQLEILVQGKGLTGQIPISVLVNPFTEFTQIQLIMAGAILVGLYVLIIFELCHRTLAAMLGELKLKLESELEKSCDALCCAALRACTFPRVARGVS